QIERGDDVVASLGGQRGEQRVEARAAGGVDVTRETLAARGERDPPAAPVVVTLALRDAAGLDQLAAQPGHVALVDAQLGSELLLRELAPAQQNDERVRVRQRERLATRGAVRRQRSKAAEQTLREAAQRVAGRLCGALRHDLPPSTAN